MGKVKLPLSNFDIEKYMKNINNFRGVFPKDKLPKKIHKAESGIVNLDNSNKPGSHWICYYNNPSYNYVEYFDSFGLQPPEELKKYLKTSNKQIAYNTSQLQDVLSTKCGLYCMHYIRERNKNITQYDVLYSFRQFPDNFNEELVGK